MIKTWDPKKTGGREILKAYVAKVEANREEETLNQSQTASFPVGTGGGLQAQSPAHPQPPHKTHQLYIGKSLQIP
jgi:hypothetical protein